MYGWFELGSRVQVQKGPMTFKGTVKAVRHTAHPVAGQIPEFGVILDGGSQVEFYAGWDLEMEEDADLEDRWAPKCGCGADTTYFPGKAPGHSYYCKKFKENK